MKNLIVTFILALFSLFWGQATFAQHQGDEVKAVKVSFITDMMKLSPAQASQFWPVYNRYDNEMRNIRKGIRALTTEKGKTAEEIIDERQKLSEREVSIKAKYNEEFLKIVSAAQLNQMYAAEAKFRQYLLDRMKKK
jgi:NCAIR mutase (PurE)-related protein